MLTAYRSLFAYRFTGRPLAAHQDWYFITNEDAPLRQTLEMTQLPPKNEAGLEEIDPVYALPTRVVRRMGLCE